MLPEFEATSGNLPPGEHVSTWADIVERFGYNERRNALLDGLLRALKSLRSAGCRKAYVDGSFVTAKMQPGDFDGCWETEGVDFDKIDEVLLTFDAGRAAQKAKFLGEFFLADSEADPIGTMFREFFQRDRDGRPKGIVVVDMGSLPP